MLSDPATRLLPRAASAADALATRAATAAASVDVLTARDAAAALEEEARLVRQGRKTEATDLALRLVVDKLTNAVEGNGTVAMDDLLRVVGTLDPDSQKGGGGPTVVAVEVVVRNELAGS